MRRKILSIFLVAAVATLVGVVVSCSPAPETGGPAQVEPIPKTLLFENTSDVATNLLRALYYERTETAHKFYFKTTVNIHKYWTELKNIEPNLGNDFVNVNDSGDLWGHFIIALDLESKSASPKNVVKMGLKIRTADPDFEFDAVIREMGGWNKPNTNDGIPIRADGFGGMILNIYNTGNAENDDFWAISGEKKYIAPDNDNDGAANKFLSGAYQRAGSPTVPSEFYRYDANLSYDSSTGEYVITIPFTVIDANDIKKVAAFGVQNSDWRPGATINAVIKPLGSSKVIVYADPNGVVRGIPVVTVPKNKNESPSLIQGSFPTVLQLTTSLDAKAGVLTNTNTITLITSTSNDASNAIVFTGPKGTSTVNVTNWLYYGGTNNQGDVLYTNKVVLILAADNLGDADFYAGTNYSISVSSLDATATISVTVEPTISLSLPVSAPGNFANATVTVVDGYDPGSTVTIKNSNTGNTHTVNLISGSGTFTIGEATTSDLVASNGHVIFAIYNDATSGKSFTNTQTLTVFDPGTLLGNGEYDNWSAKIDKVYAKSGSGKLVVTVVMNPVDAGNNLYLIVDAISKNGLQPLANDWSGDWTTGLGNFWFTNTANINADFIAWGSRNVRDFNLSGANSITNSSGATKPATGVTHFRYDISPSESWYVFEIPYSQIGTGVSANDVVNIYVFYGKSGENVPGQGGMRSMFPANASITNSGAWGNYIVDVTNKSPNYTLQ